MKYRIKRVKIIDPIVKKSDAIKAVGGERGNAADLAYFFNISDSTVSAWGEHLPPLYGWRISAVWPHLDISTRDKAA